MVVAEWVDTCGEGLGDGDKIEGKREEGEQRANGRGGTAGIESQLFSQGRMCVRVGM